MLRLKRNFITEFFQTFDQSLLSCVWSLFIEVICA